MPVLEARNLAKSFGSTKALTDGTFVINEGEVVALLGENGSGKSTMVKVLSGVIRPDAGEVLIEGQPRSFTSPRDASRAGVVTVFQEILLAPDLSIADNLLLGVTRAMRGGLSRRDMRARAERIVADLAIEFPNLSTPARELDLMQRQVCVIARALLRSPRILILDESTSTLDVDLRDRLFDTLRALCKTGVAVIFISHRMEEVLTLADRFVALRSGAVVGESTQEEATAASLLKMISDGEGVASVAMAKRSGSAEIAVVVDGVTLREGSVPVTLSVHRGEIVGLAGLEGHGQDQMLLAMASLYKPLAGSVVYADAHGERRHASYQAASRHGVAYVPRDRKVDGILDSMSVVDNYALPTYGNDSIASIIRFRLTQLRLAADAAFVNFVPRGQPAAGRLSGGNQQKLILARWLATRPDVLLLNDPTRGVDQKTKHELYEQFSVLASIGMTIVLLSSEVDELIHLCNRVVVFHAGSVSAELAGAELNRERIVAAYFAQGVAIETEGPSK